MEDGQVKIDSFEKFIEFLTLVNGKKPDRDWIESARCNGDDWWWRNREETRNRTRLIPNWINTTAWPSHPNIRNFYVFVSQLDPLKIAYTPSPEDGRRDRQVVTTPGRFLTKHFSHCFNEGSIRKIADAHRAMYGDPVLYFALGADEIEHVYMTGISTCMTTKSWPKEHPVRIYDGPDTCLAYIKTADGRITARALVLLPEDPKKPMYYTRIYGDAALMEARFKAFGVQAMGSDVQRCLKGIRLRREKARGKAVIFPYFDHANGMRASLDEDPKWVVMGGKNGFEPTTTGGMVGRHDEHDGVYCSGCETEYPDGTPLTATWYGSNRCATCIERYYYQVQASAAGATQWVTSDDMIELDGIYYLSDGDALESMGIVYSEYYDEYVRTNEVTMTAMNHLVRNNEVITDVDGRVHPRAACTALPDGEWVNPACPPKGVRQRESGGWERFKEIA